jgi:competence protein ComEA
MRTELPAERLHRRLGAEPDADSRTDAVNDESGDPDDDSDDDPNSLLPRWLPETSRGAGWFARVRADPGRAGAVALALVAALALLHSPLQLIRCRWATSSST